MPRPRLKADDRTTTRWAVDLEASEAAVLDAYCDAKGYTRREMMRRMARQIRVGSLNPEASQFRRLQEALLPMEAE